jgi:hypothetical protein
MPDADLTLLAHQLQSLKITELGRLDRKNSGDHGLYRHGSGDNTHTDEKEKQSW